MRSEHEDGFSPTDADRPSGQSPAATPAIESRRDEITKPSGKPAVVEEVLIEEVSIDGMCGVY